MNRSLTKRPNFNNSRFVLINNKKRMGDDVIQKVKDENDVLLQQADMLAKELNDAHSSIAERDSSIASLSNELSGLLEKARTLSEYIKISLSSVYQYEYTASNHYPQLYNL